MEEKDEQSACHACGYSADTGPESLLHLPPGTVLQGKYLIGRVLGQGGFGITYLAYDTTLNIKLAIKEYLPQYLATRATGQNEVSVIKSSLLNDFKYGLSKFLEEARTLARFIEHPNVVSVRDFFEANGTAYLVMGYVEGLTFQKYLENKGGIVDVEQALQIFMPVLDALKDVHTTGILHRDISPENLLIDTTGRVVLVDFGAARQAMGVQSKSLSVIMKAGYSPEEQYRSKGVQGPWTDIYAVAATLYHTITGVMPLESLDRLVEDSLVPPSHFGVECSYEFEQVLLKALEVRAQNRYQAVEEFQAELLAVTSKRRVENIEPDNSVKEKTTSQRKYTVRNAASRNLNDYQDESAPNSNNNKVKHVLWRKEIKAAGLLLGFIILAYFLLNLYLPGFRFLEFDEPRAVPLESENNASEHESSDESNIVSEDENLEESVLQEDTVSLDEPEIDYNPEWPLLIDLWQSTEAEEWWDYDTEAYLHIDGFKLNLGAKKQEVVQNLGEPDRIDIDYYYGEEVPFLKLFYNDLIISCYYHEPTEDKDDALIYNLETTSSDVFGPRNIRVGDSFESLNNKFLDEGNPVKPSEPSYVSPDSDGIEYERVLYGDSEIDGPFAIIYYDNQYEPKEVKFLNRPYGGFTTVWVIIFFEDNRLDRMDMGYMIQ